MAILNTIAAITPSDLDKRKDKTTVEIRKIFLTDFELKMRP